MKINDVPALCNQAGPGSANVAPSVAQVAAYTRTKSQEQVEGYSIEAQLAMIRGEVERRGWDVAQTFADFGRPNLVRLIEDARQRSIDGIVVSRLDRLTRDTDDLESVLQTLCSECGVRVVSVAEQVDTGTGIGQAHLKVALAFCRLSQAYSRELGARIRQGQHLKKAYHGDWRTPRRGKAPVQ